MAIIGHHNAWWWDTLENGEASRCAPYFDIDWNAQEERLHNQILLPVLGDHYGRVLAAGEISMERQGGHFVVRYHEHTFPAAPESQIVSIPRMKIGAALVLCAPFLPMLFQGEEFGASSPVLYFTDHCEPGLAAAVSRGHWDRVCVEFCWMQTWLVRTRRHLGLSS